LQDIKDYEYDLAYKCDSDNREKSFDILKQLINTEILDKLSFSINCTTCSIFFTKNDLNIKILPMICFTIIRKTYYANCSVCNKSNMLGNGSNTSKNRQAFFNIIKERFIDNKEPCSTCGTVYYGIKWWNGSAFIDYSGE
jgi:hypothetical protein